MTPENFSLFKMNSYHRIFNNSTVGAQKPKWISPRSQLAICSGLVSIQVRTDQALLKLFSKELKLRVVQWKQHIADVEIR